MKLLYRLLLILAWPLVLLYFAFRVMRQPAYFRTLPERLGWLPRSIHQTASGAIWLHAVSVGEVLACVELVRQLRKMLPEAAIFISTTTLAGRRLADQKLLSLVDGIFYSPLDFPFAVRAALRRLKPTILVILETEIWPSLFSETRAAGASLLIVNGRISDRALPKYRRFRWFFQPTLAVLNRILVQSEPMRERFLEAGAPPASLQVGGNLKYDFQPAAPSAAVVQLVDSLKPCEVWIAASTMPPDEDDTVIRSFHELAARHPRLLLVLAPRKPERFQLVADRLPEAGIRFVRRTALPAPLELPGVLLLDTVGELAGLFALADVVFVGGSLVNWGGHNVLEPAVFAKPIVVGPYMMNFREMAAKFAEADAYLEVADGRGLTNAVDRLLGDRDFSRELGERARRCAESERGATRIAAEAICELYAESLPSYRPPLSWALWPLSRLWSACVRIDRARTPVQRLDAPVVSVGNLSVGGTGKTPFVLALAEHWRSPAILTRGYGRQVSKALVLPPGAQASTGETGDEAQAYLRQGRAWVAIGPDRAANARMIRKPDVFILDDGFQHWPVARDLDIVLVDALDPAGGGDVLPRGRLREPPESLARAGILVITRSKRKRPGIERWLRRYNSAAPIFYAHAQPLHWIEGSSGKPVELPQGRPVAFCGIGNPESFWSTLREWGVEPASRITFADHHRYSAGEIHQLLAGAPFAVTTQKDWVKLQNFGLPSIFWLDIRLQIDREKEFWAEVDHALSPRLA